VEAFLRDAEAILETAVNSASAEATEFAVLIGVNGSMRMVDAAGWNLHALAVEFGAHRTYRVERRFSSIRLEGVSGGRTVVLEQKRRPAASPAPPPVFTSNAVALTR
jgi:hypothetical protein